ncbi:MAG TPA: carboxypeptidase-like regulatory domain-containing protein [Candidatus Cloacimonadota bacterium]|nr:carboxypeptidase-like regulatory domain-containing protein [Candidatus Cloacimonadota bacterium]
MKYLFRIFLAVLFAGLILTGCDNSNPNDEPGTVQGKVGDTNGQSLDGICITDGTNTLGYTDNDGDYHFQIDKGTYDFYFSGNGYITHVEYDVEVKAGKTTDLDVLMNLVEVEDITSNIGLNVTWNNNKIYHISNDIIITGELTIGKGTIIKFDAGAGWDVQNEGKITAMGTELEPIYFTSWYDDNIGGDSNNDGNATSPARGDWESIDLGGIGNNSIFNHCYFQYGGCDGEVLWLNFGTEVSITYCSIVNNLSANGAINASLAFDGTEIENNDFYDNEWPLCLSLGIDLDNSNSFLSPNTTQRNNDHAAIKVTGNTLQGTATWSETEIPFVFLNDSYEIKDDTSLILNSGTILKMNQSTCWTVYGTLDVNGEQSSPVVFTSYKDDDELGDTNNDGDASTPAVGDWDCLKFEGTNNSSNLNYAVFKYSGGSSDEDYTLYLGSNTTVTVTNCTFTFNDGLEDCVLNAKEAAANTNLQYNIFYSNQKPLAINSKISIDATNIFVNANSSNLETNVYNGVFVKSGSDVEGNVQWLETQVPFVLSGEVRITSGNSLTLAEDVVLKFNGGSLVCEDDNLNYYSADNVWFTSYQDDAHGEDTNGDGAATTPQNGDWEGVEMGDVWQTWNNILYDSH